MGGKKTCEKSREWEKERREKLNVCFNDLYKLLPDHDPSMSLSKMDILRKAAEYIRQLQEQNEEILKSGDDVLKDKTERLRKRVAYLVLKTKDLVSALKAAGVPIPNNKSNKSKNKGNPKPVSGKDQNLVPHNTGNGVKPIIGAPRAPLNTSSTKKVKCGCDKAAKKNPLSEVNGATTKSPAMPTVESGAAAVPSSPQTTIFNSQNPPVHPSNIENAALTSTLGAGTIIFRDGRVITVPPPSPIIPQILVKPQPAVIVMQRATPVAVKRDKFPLIFPKRRDITQTTYMNKAPIPAIKTFRLESPPKKSKSSPKTKKKKILKVESTSELEKRDESCVVTSGVENNVHSSSFSQPTSIKNRKRKADATTNKASKVFKSCGSVAVSTNERHDVTQCNLHENIVTSYSNNIKGSSIENGPDWDEESPVKLCESEVISPAPSTQPATLNDDESNRAEDGVNVELEGPSRSESLQAVPEPSDVCCQQEIVSEREPADASIKLVNSKVSEQPKLPTTCEPFDVTVLEKRKNSAPDTKELPSASSTSSENGPLLNLPVLSVSQGENDGAPVLQKEAIQNDADCPESLVSAEVCHRESIGNSEVFKPFDDTDDRLRKPELFSSVDVDDTESHGTKTDLELRKTESIIDNGSIAASQTETTHGKTREKLMENVAIIEPEKMCSLPSSSTHQKNSIAKLDSPERSSLMQTVRCSENVNNQYDLNMAEPVNPEQMFSFDDSVHEQLDSFSPETAKPQPAACAVAGNSLSTVADHSLNSDSYKKDSLTLQRKGLNGVSDDNNTCADGAPSKIATSHEDTPSKTSSSSCKLLNLEKSNHMVTDTRDILPGQNMVSSCFKNTGSDGSNMLSTNVLVPSMALDKHAVGIKSFQSQTKVSAIDKVPSSIYTSGSQMYCTVTSEQSRAEGFFSYENPIATFPSADPFFSNLTGKTVDVGSVPCTATPSTCFSYTNFTTQTPPVRSVARQLFPADPLCSIANSYNLLNSRQSELDANLPHLSATNSQMFPFTSYSTASSYRDPVFFANEFVGTPTKAVANVGTSENLSQNEKSSSALHPTHNYTDLLHSTANMNNFSNVSCNFSVAPSTAACIPIDFNPITSSQSKPSHKQFTVAEPQSILVGNQPKQIPKSCNNEGNFSMNMITSSSSSKSEMKTHTQCPASEPTGYPKPINSSHNLSFNYLHPPSQTHSAPTNQEVGYNLYMRDTMPPPKDLPNHHFRSTSHAATLNSSVNAEKNIQKLPNNGLSSLKPSITKEFSTASSSSGLSSETTRERGDRFGVQSNVFHNNCYQYPDQISKGRRVHSSASSGSSNLQGGGSSQLSSSNQGVQTQQSYLGSTSTQQTSHMTKNAVHNMPAVNQPFSGSTQSANRQNHLTNADKYSRVASMHQVLPLIDSAPSYSMKSNLGRRLNNSDGADCVPSHHSENYQTSAIQTSSSIPSQNQEVFSSSNVFSHSNFSSHHRSYHGPTFSCYPNVSKSNNTQAVYTNPTTAVLSNQGYLQNINTSSAGTVLRGQGQNSLSLSNPTKATPVFSSQLTNPGIHPPSTTGQVFSAVESLAHHSQNNNKNPSNTPTNGNTVQHQGQAQPASNPPNGNFPGGITSQSVNNSTNQKSVRNDRMSSFSMSNIASYSQTASSGNIDTQHAISKRLHSSGHSYSHLQTSSQNVGINKSSSHYSSAPANHLPSSKQCDYPLASILTGLSDPILSGSSLINEPNLTSHLNKNASLPGMTDKIAGCRDKVVNKQYSTNTEGNSFKTTDNSCNTDYLRSKENERNSFIPIIEDVRLNSEFSNDLFSSLQVPTGGAHSDSISPTAAFLLAFPLVSTSKNTENLHDQDPADNNTSTPTTILQIGNIEPPNSELFHPLEFGKDMETSDYLGHDQDKCKRKESSSQEKQKKQIMSTAYPQTYNYPAMSGDFGVPNYDQPWSENLNKSKTVVDRKKNEKSPKQFTSSSNAYEFCKQDKKKKNKISVNWMAAPDAGDSFQKEVETSSFPTANLPFPMDIDGLPDFCSSKKNNSGIYSWSPSKSLLPIDNGLLIPSTLPTLVGDLALGTTTPSDPFVKRCDNKKTLDKQPDKNQNPQKAQNNFLSVSQLVDPKSKKQKIPETKCKKPEKKKAASFTKRKDVNEPCMYPDFLPPLGWDKYRYKNNYSAEALIGSQDINESLNFSYQQNANYFMGTDFSQEHHPQSQQYQNSFSFSQNQFSSFVAEEYQNDNFSLNQPQGSSKRGQERSDKRDGRCRDETSSRFLGVGGSNPSHYHHSTSSMQPYPAPTVPSSSTVSSQPSSFPSNTTTSVTNFNLSTIFPEINERTGSQGQQNPTPQTQQNHQQQQQNSILHHPHNSMNSFSNNTNNSYRPHNI